MLYKISIVSKRMHILFIWKAIYIALFKVYKLFMGRGISCQIWYRNSLALNSFSPPRSDIDVSIFLNDFNLGTLKNIMRKHNMISKILPLFKEVNTFPASKMTRVLACANYYELNRDPVLKGVLANQILFQHNDPQSLEVQKACFLLKMLESDLDNLKYRIQQRQGKWKQHFSDLELEAPYVITIKLILEQIVRLAGLPHHLSKLESLVERDFEYYENDRSIWFFGLVNFIYYDIFLLTGASPIIPEMSDAEQRLCVEIIRWEIWGLITQLPFLDREEASNHLDNLRLYVRSNVSPQNQVVFDELINDFSRISTW